MTETVSTSQDKPKQPLKIQNYVVCPCGMGETKFSCLGSSTAPPACKAVNELGFLCWPLHSYDSPRSAGQTRQLEQTNLDIPLFSLHVHLIAFSVPKTKISSTLPCSRAIVLFQSSSCLSSTCSDEQPVGLRVQSSMRFVCIVVFLASSTMSCRAWARGSEVDP